MINGLSDLLHPCQALADYFTLRERRGEVRGLKMAYIGDGNNVAHALMFGAVKLGCYMSVGCPSGYEPNQLIFKSAAREAQKLGSPVPEVTNDPLEAAAGAGIRFVVADRPNPVGGLRVQGNVLDPAFVSFVGPFPVAMRHGMTTGELALLFNAEYGIDAALQIVPASGWARESWAAPR